ncbi:hypothetical protein ABS642_11405 [Microbacterium sp. A8/3-1]|uniref:ATP-grasp domain-containing protein n=1 Tax=Microbacterium sp. A8/3-1 TaxID=3160749 RepID=A0AAU7VRB5_9MICO
MTAVNVVLFRHSPRPVELWHLNHRDALILSHESSRARYNSDPAVDESMVRFLEDFEVPTLFRAIRDIAQKHTIRSVSTLGEEDMATAGLLEEFFVTGVSEYVAGTLFKDKLFMRSALEGQIPQPEFRGLEEFTGTREQLLAEGFNLVKPRRSAGAQGVHLLNEIDDEEFAAIPLGDYIAESFIQTPRMVTGDGFAVGHDMRHFYVHEYDATVLSSLDGRDGIAISTSKVYDESSDLLKALFDSSLRVLETIGSRDRVNPFHFEWFIPEDGVPVFCEVGRRFGGLGIPRIARYAFDAPVLEDYWAAMAGEAGTTPSLTRETLAHPRRRAICYARYRVKGEVISAPTSEDFNMAENSWIWAKPGDEFAENAGVVTDNAAIFEFIGTDAGDVEAKLAQARSILDERLVIR